LDECEDYFYTSCPESKAWPYGYIAELKNNLRKSQLKSFKWLGAGGSRL
jgi:hypothetical protein